MLLVFALAHQSCAPSRPPVNTCAQQFHTLPEFRTLEAVLDSEFSEPSVQLLSNASVQCQMVGYYPYGSGMTVAWVESDPTSAKWSLGTKSVWREADIESADLSQVRAISSRLGKKLAQTCSTLEKNASGCEPSIRDQSWVATINHSTVMIAVPYSSRSAARVNVLVFAMKAYADGHASFAELERAVEDLVGELR